jgi:hypothetical protein
METGPGLRLRLAMREASIAVRKIREVRAYYGPIHDQGGTPYATLQAWRRQYIKACNVASHAIEHLWEGYQWPPDGARTSTYSFKPKDPA